MHNQEVIGGLLSPPPLSDASDAFSASLVISTVLQTATYPDFIMSVNGHLCGC